MFVSEINPIARRIAGSPDLKELGIGGTLTHPRNITRARTKKVESGRGEIGHMIRLAVDAATG